jgi:hypothetical protein
MRRRSQETRHVPTMHEYFIEQAIYLYEIN